VTVESAKLTGRALGNPGSVHDDVEPREPIGNRGIHGVDDRAVGNHREPVGCEFRERALSIVGLHVVHHDGRLAREPRGIA
jgi:hypothetical protein